MQAARTEPSSASVRIRGIRLRCIFLPCRLVLAQIDAHRRDKNGIYIWTPPAWKEPFNEGNPCHGSNYVRHCERSRTRTKHFTKLVSPHHNRSEHSAVTASDPTRAAPIRRSAATASRAPGCSTHSAFSYCYGRKSGATFASGAYRSGKRDPRAVDENYRCKKSEARRRGCREGYDGPEIEQR